MSRKFTGGRLVVASHNQGKVREIAALLAPFGVTPVSAGELGLPEPEETGSSFIENAELKARAAAIAAGIPALADDSGLAVAKLEGAPGLYSARWAGPGRDFGEAMRKVWDGLMARNAVSRGDRGAEFICALSLAWPDGHAESFEGRVAGEIVWPPRGGLGFGYDPMFQPREYALTFGEIAPDVKHAISHRADAFQQLIAACFDPK